MYFITKKDSETGKKFEDVSSKIILARQAQRELANQIGFNQWRDGYWVLTGGFSAVIFETEPDKKVWKNVNGSKNEWLPRLNTKAGKEINNLFSKMPIVRNHQLNMCIGFDGAPFQTIGFALNNDEYFGFATGDSWKVEIPNDCTEVTLTKYNQLFKKDTQ